MMGNDVASYCIIASMRISTAVSLVSQALAFPGAHAARAVAADRLLQLLPACPVSLPATSAAGDWDDRDDARLSQRY